MKERDYINATNARTLVLADDVLKQLLFVDEDVQREIDAMRARLAVLRNQTFKALVTRERRALGSAAGRGECREMNNAPCAH